MYNSFKNLFNFTDIQNRAYYRSVHERNLESFEANCPDGYTIKIDETGIHVYDVELLMHLHNGRNKCYVCGMIEETHQKNQVDNALVHLKRCLKDFNSSIKLDLCTVCDKHWLRENCVFNTLDYKHATGLIHRQAMANAKRKHYYDFIRRQDADDAIVESEHARAYLAKEPQDQDVLQRYVSASIELVMSAPEYETSGLNAPYRKAMAGQLGAINCHTIVTIINVLEHNQNAANIIYADIYGEDEPTSIASAPPDESASAPPPY